MAAVAYILDGQKFTFRGNQYQYANGGKDLLRSSLSGNPSGSFRRGSLVRNQVESATGRRSVADKPQPVIPRQRSISKPISIGAPPMATAKKVLPTSKKPASKKQEVVTAPNPSTGKSFVPSSLKAQGSQQQEAKEQGKGINLKKIAATVGIGWLLKKLLKF